MKKRAIFVVGMMFVLVCVIALNWKYSFFNNLFSQDPTGENPPATEVGGSVTEPEDNYFENARYTRNQSRQEALSLLNSIINDEAVDEDVRRNAYNEVVSYAKITEGEASLESVLRAKGFDECIVFLTVDTATVVVAAEALSQQQSAQIFDAVLTQTGFESGSVRIVTYP